MATVERSLLPLPRRPAPPRLRSSVRKQDGDASPRRPQPAADSASGEDDSQPMAPQFATVSASARWVDPVAGAAAREKALHGRDAAVARVVARVVAIASLKKGSTGRTHAASEATPPPLALPPLAIGALPLWRSLQQLAASPTAVLAYTQAQELAVGFVSFAMRWWWAVLIFVSTVECVELIGCNAGTIGPGSLAMIFA